MSYKYETHMHTSEVSACASATASEQVKNYKDRGYTGIIITNHFVNSYVTHEKNLPWAQLMEQNTIGYKLAKQAGDKHGLDVFFGFEYTIEGWDFLTYGITIECLLENPGMDKLSPEEYSKFVRSNGGYLAQAHPYREAYYIPNPHPVAPELIDGVEVYNASMTPEINQKAKDFAELHGLPKISGSDCHHLGTEVMGGIVLENRARDINDIIRALKAKEVGIISQ